MLKQFKSIVFVTNIVLAGCCGTAYSVEQYPETREEIEAYKEFVIQRQHERMDYPEEPVTISTLEELAEYSGKSNVHVKMKPGTYQVTLDNFTDFIGISPEVYDHAYVFHFGGRNSLFDLSGVTIKVDTRILSSYAKPLDIDGRRKGMEKILVTGEDLIIRGLTVEGVHEIRKDQGPVEAKIVETDASHNPHYVNYSFDGNDQTSFSMKGSYSHPRYNWVMYRLDKPIQLESVSLQTKEGRELPFTIQVAKGAATEWYTDWQTVYQGTMTDKLESYEFDEVTADRVRISGHGDQKGFNNFAQVRIGDLKWPDAYPEATNHAPSRSARTLKVVGKRILLEGVTVISRGSRPYGYGRLLGKGADPIEVAMNKHTALGTAGDDLVFVDCKVYARSYGHAWNFGMNNNITAIDCVIEGEIRSTNDMLKETVGPLVEANYKNIWTQQRIKPGMMVSLQEDTFRSYGWPFEPKGREPGKIKLLGCTVKNTSSGTALGGYRGDVFISNMTVIGNTQKGYAVPSRARIVNSKADTRYAPALDLYNAHHTEIQIKLLPSRTPEMITRQRFGNHRPWPKAAAYITGNGHDIVIESVGRLTEEKPIVLGYARQPRRTQDVRLENRTALPVILTEETRNCIIITDGEVTDKGENNEIRSLSSHRD